MATTRTRLGKMPALPIRHMGGTGRITLPHRVRRELQLQPNDQFTVDVVNGCIIIRPVGDAPCPHCAGTGAA